MRQRFVALVAAASLVLGVPAPSIATDNVALKWTPSGNSATCCSYYIRFYFQSGWPSSAQTAVRAGRSVWNNVGRQLYFASESARTSSSDVDLNWSLAFYCGWADYLACATYGQNLNGNIQNGSLYFDTSRSWYTGTSGTPGIGQFDLYSVAIHEWGHLVQLGHSTGSGDVMLKSIATRETRRVLTTHDKAGIQYLYGAR